MTATLPLTLNRDEVRLLSDRLKADELHDMGTKPFDIYGLLLRLGILFLDLVDPDSDVKREGTIAVTEAEAWLLRGKVNSGDKMADDSKMGIRLLRKIYAVLIEFNVAVAGLLEAGEDGQRMGAWEKQALSVWEKRVDGDNHGDLQPTA